MTSEVAIAASARRVAVIGGGVVGAAAALLAERSGAQVWLFEPKAPALDCPEPKTLSEWPIRHVALAPASLQLLERLGVEQSFAHGVFTRMLVWEQWGTAQLQFDVAELPSLGLGCEVLGWIAELPALTGALWRRVDQLRGIVPVVGQPVTALHANPDRTWAVQHAEHRTEVDLVLIADGARSAMRDALGVQAQTAQTGHHALATVVRTTDPHGQIARQRFLLDGPLALLPSRGERIVSVVWSQSPEQAQRRLALPDTQFCEALTEASEGVLGRIEAVGQRAAFPVIQQLADTFVPAPSAVLLGDAARVLHPLAGLGVNLGLEDVAALEPLLGAQSNARWSAWSRQRRARSRLVQRALATLQGTYGSQGPSAALVRNLGVRLVGGSSLLRKVLIREALGL